MPATTTVNKPILAALEIPDQTWVLYENMVLRDTDRTGNWRFMIRQDGCFFNARNTQLWLEDVNQFESDDPALFWNTPFPDKPDRCFTESQQEELQETLQGISFSSLEAYYPSDSLEDVSSPEVKRWTVVQDGEPHTVIVEEDATPAQLVTLRTKIDQLVAGAPRPE